MAFPPDPLATDKTNDTDIPDDHPDHHNAIAAAVNDTVGELVDFEADTATALADKAAAADLTAHIGDTSDAHDAAAISYGGGTGMSATDVEAAIDELATEKLSALTPWTSTIDGGDFSLTNVQLIELGTSLPNNQITANRNRTLTATGTYACFRLGGVTTHNTGNNQNYRALDMRPTVAGSSLILGTVMGFFANPQVTHTGVCTALYGGQLNAQYVPTGGTATCAAAYGFQSTITCTSGTVTLGIGVEVTSAGAGTIDEFVAIRATNVATGTLKWGMQVGDYQSYHHGRLSLGAATAPTYALDIKGTAQDRGAIGIIESAATPTNPSSSDQAVVYVRANKIIFAWNDAGTMRYKYLDLTGTGVTWTHTTTAPT